MYKDFELDENQPDKKNIEYVMSKLLYCLNASMYFSDYVQSKDKIYNVLTEFNTILDIYVNTNHLLDIEYDKLDSIASQISNLDYDNINKNGLYLEMADVWISILIGYYNILRINDYGKK